MNIEELLVEILQIYTNIDSIGDLYNICKEHGYIGTINDFVYEIKKIFNDYDIIENLENSKIDTKEELQVTGGRKSLQKKLTAGFLAGLVSIPSGFSAKYNESNGHKKSISSTNDKLSKHETTFEKFIYNFINKRDLRTYSLLGLSVVGIPLVLFLISYIHEAKNLDNGLSAFIGVLNQKKNLSEQNLIDACNKLQPLIDAKKKELKISITNRNSQLSAFDNSGNVALKKVDKIKKEIEILKERENKSLYQRVITEIALFLKEKSNISGQTKPGNPENRNEMEFSITGSEKDALDSSRIDRSGTDKENVSDSKQPEQSAEEQKPGCKRIYRAIKNFVNKRKTQDDAFVELYIEPGYRFQLLEEQMPATYEGFQDFISTNMLPWDLARKVLDVQNRNVQNRNVQNRNVQNRSNQVVKCWEVANIPALLELYYSHQVKLYFTTLSRNQRIQLAQKMNPSFLVQNCKLHEIPDFVKKYQECFSSIRNPELADALCYKLITTLADVFEHSNDSLSNVDYCVGEYGLDFLHSLDILDQVVNRAMKAFMNEDKSPEEIYKLLIETMTIELKKIGCPGLISEKDKEFSDLVKALKGEENRNSPKRGKLIDLLTKAYYRSRAKQISHGLNDAKRKEISKMLTTGPYTTTNLDRLLKGTEAATGIYAKEPERDISMKPFLEAYRSAPKEKRKCVNDFLLSQIVISRPRINDTTSTEELARIVFAWPKYYNEFKNAKFPGSMLKKNSNSALNSQMMELIGYVMYSNDNPLEHLPKSLKVYDDSKTRYENIVKLLKKYHEAFVGNQTNEWTEAFLLLRGQVVSEKSEIDYELFGKCCVVLEDNNQQIKKQIIEDIRSNPDETIIIDENPTVIKKIYKPLKKEPKKMEHAKQLLGIQDSKANEIDVIRALLNCNVTDQARILKELELGINVTKTFDLHEGMFRNNTAVGRPLRKDLRTLLVMDEQLLCEENGNEERKPLPDLILGSTEFCAHAIESILKDIVHGREKEQRELIELLEENYDEQPNFDELSNDDILKLIRTVTKVEIEKINSTVFSILMSDDGSLDKVLNFAASDYSDKVNSNYFGTKKRTTIRCVGNRYWKEEFYTKGLLQEEDSKLDQQSSEQRSYITRKLYTTDADGKKLREAYGVPKIESELFQKTIELVMKNEDENSLIPKEKFYSFVPNTLPMSPEEIAEWYSFPRTYGMPVSREDKMIKQILSTKYKEFVTKWCTNSAGKTWQNQKNAIIFSYLLEKVSIFTEDNQYMTYQYALQHPLVVAMAVFEKLADHFKLQSRKDLDKLYDQDRQNHPLEDLLTRMEMAFMATDNVCKSEAEEMCIMWYHLILDTYYAVTCDMTSTSNSDQDEKEKFIGKICYETRRKAMQRMILTDPIAIHPVHAVGAGQQMAVVYSDALNVQPDSTRFEFNLESGEACGTAEFVTPAAPNRVRAKNASKSLTLGSIIANASEIRKKEGQKDKEIIDKITNETKGKKRTFDDLVRVFDDKSLLLTANELLSEENTKYYFGEPTDFDNSWNLRSRLQAYLDDLKQYSYNNEIRNGIVVLQDWIYGQKQISLNELVAILEVESTLFINGADADGEFLSKRHHIEHVGRTFTTDILPLYLVDSGYIGWAS